MALISRLAVALTVDTGKFASKLRSAEKSVGGFGSSIGSALTGTTAKMAGLLGAITGVAGVAGLGLLIKKQAEFIDSTSKLADQIGETTENLIGLQHAANLGGVASESLEKSLEFLQKALGNPSGETNKALESLGLTVNDLLGKRAVDQLGIVADRLKNLTLQEEKAAAARALFGRTGADFITILKDGSEGLRKTAAEAKELGAAFSRIDGAKVEQARDNVARLQTVLTGLSNKLTIALAAPVAALSGMFVDMAKAGISAAGDLSSAYEIVGDIVGDIIAGIESGFNSVRRLASVTLRSLATLRGLGGPLADTEKTQRLIDSATRLDESIGVSMAQRDLGQDFAGRYRARLAEENKAAASAAKAISDQLTNQNRAREWTNLIGNALTTGLRVASPYLNSTLNTAIAKPFEMSADSLLQLGSSLSPIGELFSDSVDSLRFPNADAVVSAAASAGTRGTFASDTAGRMSGAFKIQQQQLEALDKIADATQITADFIKDGVPAG